MFYRKFRWAFEATFPSGKIESKFIKMSVRPNIEESNSELDYLSAKSWVPGKLDWQTITTTFLDVTADSHPDLFSAIAKIYDYASTDTPLEPNLDMAGEITLKLLFPKYEKDPEIKTEDPPAIKSPMGLGALGSYKLVGWGPLEEWTLQKAYPTRINFGELNFSSKEECDVEVTWRYAKAIYKNYQVTLPTSHSTPAN